MDDLLDGRDLAVRDLERRGLRFEDRLPGERDRGRLDRGLYDGFERGGRDLGDRGGRCDRFRDDGVDLGDGVRLVLEERRWRERRTVRLDRTPAPPSFLRRGLLGHGVVGGFEDGLGGRLDDRVGGDVDHLFGGEVDDLVDRRGLSHFGRRARLFGRGGCRCERGIDTSGGLLGPPAPAPRQDRLGLDCLLDRFVGRFLSGRNEGIDDRVVGRLADGSAATSATGLVKVGLVSVNATGGSAAAAISGSGSTSTGRSYRAAGGGGGASWRRGGGTGRQRFRALVSIGPTSGSGVLIGPTNTSGACSAGESTRAEETSGSTAGSATGAGR